MPRLRRNLNACLRSVVLVREPALRERLDLQRVGLGTVSRTDQFVMRALRLREPDDDLPFTKRPASMRSSCVNQNDLQVSG